jgi:hypothetical protein
MVNRRTAPIAVAMAVLAAGPAWADAAANCATLAQAAAAGMGARISADDQTIKPPASVTTLSCLDNFFNGVGLNVITNLLDPTSLPNTVEGKICSLVQTEWNNITGAAQCGLTITGFNVGFGNLGGGTFCPKLSFGGGGASLGSIGTGLSNGQTGLSINGTGIPPTGYTLPTGVNF